AELFEKHGIPCPKTLIVHRDNRSEVAPVLGFPCVLKQPDSAFSMGVVKVNDASELDQKLDLLLASSELVVAQKFEPSSFDWRVGVIDGRPLHVCRYHMAKGHWQIRKAEGQRKPLYGKVDTMDAAEAPKEVIDCALKAANLVGRGLYGVDLKEVNGRILVIEINDNPSIDAGFEDGFMGEALYLEIMSTFLRRLDALRDSTWENERR
ncbi:MAG: ATP-grasp domain-containing protein, partial [Myxococcales bacterium]|nr:ATP-grasp domain-containing protein [Myxococcales bacterium]